MKKNKIIYNDEINLFEIAKIFWKSKIKIFLIAITFFLLALVNNNFYSKNIYKSSSVIKSSDDQEFLKLSYVDSILTSTLIIKKTDYKKSTELLIKFLNELLDYEELILVLRNNNKIKEEILNLPKFNQEKILLGYAKKLNAILQDDYSSIVVTFNWDNDEVQSILHDTILLTLQTLENSIYNEYEEKISIAETIVTRNNEISDIITNESFEAVRKIFLNKKYFESLKDTLEVEQILNNFIKYKSQRDYLNLKKVNEIDFLSEELNSLKSSKVEWVNYNLNLSTVEVKKIDNYDLKITTIVGLIIGVIYSIVSNAIVSQRSRRKNR